MSDLAELLAFCRAEQRVCPLPQRWGELWKMLPDRRRGKDDWEPPLPLILGGWHYSSDDEKRDRLEEHVRWAADHGALDLIDSYLRSLPGTDWHRVPN